MNKGIEELKKQLGLMDKRRDMALKIVEYAVCHPDEFGDHLVEMIPENELNDAALKDLYTWVDNQNEAAWLRNQEVE